MDAGDINQASGIDQADGIDQAGVVTIQFPPDYAVLAGTPPPQGIPIPMPGQGQPMATPIPTPGQGLPMATPVLGQPMASPILGQPMASPVLGQPIASPVLGQPMATPVLGRPMATPVFMAAPAQMDPTVVAALGQQYRDQLFAQCAIGNHERITRYGMLGIITAIVCFPCGLIFLFIDVEEKCARCGANLGRR